MMWVRKNSGHIMFAFGVLIVLLSLTLMKKQMFYLLPFNIFQSSLAVLFLLYRTLKKNDNFGTNLFFLVEELCVIFTSSCIFLTLYLELPKNKYIFGAMVVVLFIATYLCRVISNLIYSPSWINYDNSYDLFLTSQNIEKYMKNNNVFQCFVKIPRNICQDFKLSISYKKIKLLNIAFGVLYILYNVVGIISIFVILRSDLLHVSYVKLILLENIDMYQRTFNRYVLIVAFFVFAFLYYAGVKLIYRALAIWLCRYLKPIKTGGESYK